MPHPALAKALLAADPARARRYQKLTGSQAHSEPLADPDEMGRRVHGVDLKEPLLPAQAELYVTLLDHFGVLSFPDQGGDEVQPAVPRARWPITLAPPFLTRRITRIIWNTKDWSAAVIGSTPERQAANLCDLAFPHRIKCVDGADSPRFWWWVTCRGAVLIKTSNTAAPALHWHTDIEFEPVPLSTSMFYVQCAPTARRPDTGNWIIDVPPAEGFYHPDSGTTLTARRLAMPLNGETAYADTVRAFADLPLQEQAKLEQTMVRRRVRQADAGWLAPLVCVNPSLNRHKVLHTVHLGLARR